MQNVPRFIIRIEEYFCPLTIRPSLHCAVEKHNNRQTQISSVRSRLLAIPESIKSVRIKESIISMYN